MGAVNRDVGGPGAHVERVPKEKRIQIVVDMGSTSVNLNCV